MPALFALKFLLVTFKINIVVNYNLKRLWLNMLNIYHKLYYFKIKVIKINYVQ